MTMVLLTNVIPWNELREPETVYKKPNAFERRLLKLEVSLQKHLHYLERKGKPKGFLDARGRELWNALQKGWKELR